MSDHSSGTSLDVVRGLWLDLGRRPETGEVIAALSRAGFGSSPQWAHRVRAQAAREDAKLPRTTKAEDQLAIVREMAQEGASDRQIGSRIGMHPGSVSKLRARHGVSSGFKFDNKHGTTYTYQKGCRCDACAARNATSTREWQQRRAERLRLGTANFKHGGSSYANWGCRCKICTEANTKRSAPFRDRWNLQNPERRKERDRATLAKLQSETREKAARHGYEWTGPELEMAARSDLTAKEVALVIGRTYAAVQAKRRLLESDPKTIAVAGVARGDRPHRNTRVVTRP